MRGIYQNAESTFPIEFFGIPSVLPVNSSVRCGKGETLDYISAHCRSLVFGQWVNKGEVNLALLKQTNNETFETRLWNRFIKRREMD